jgi:hypothetical protein
MHYTYVLYSEKDCEWHTGITSDYLKTGRGKRYLRRRLAAWRGLLSREKLERH